MAHPHKHTEFSDKMANVELWWEQKGIGLLAYFHSHIFYTSGSKTFYIKNTLIRYIQG